MNLIDKFKAWYRGLPDKKRYIEFVTAVLTVPVLLTVIINNVSMMKNAQKTQGSSTSSSNPTNSPQVITIIQKEATGSGNPKTTATPSPSLTPSPTQTSCKPHVGPVSIIYPSDGEVVAKNPVCLQISYPDQSYCPVVWSYKINDGVWSDFTDKDICIYNLDAGTKQLFLKVRSAPSKEETLLQRSFVVAGPTPTPTQSTSTDSGTTK